MSGNRVGVSARGRALAVGLATLLAAGTALAGVGAPAAYAAEQVYTHSDGATITYNSEVKVGEPIVLSGTNWMTKEGHSETEFPYEVFEGDEGSIIGVKFFAPDGTVVRQEKVVNPWNGDTDYASPDVWDIIQAAGTGSWWEGAEPGSWRVEIPWPTADLATNPPSLEPGDTFGLQFLGGTLYGNVVSTDPTVQARRPDVSRTVRLDFTVVGDEPAAPLAVSQQPQPANAASGAEVSFSAATSGGKAPVTVQWQRSQSLSATTVPANFLNLSAAQAVGGSQAQPTLTVVAGPNPNGNNRWYRAVFTDADGVSVTTDAVKLSIAPVPTVVTHPLGQTVETGETATFTAAGSSTIDMTLQWQSTRIALANGEPNDTTWADVPGATEATLAVEGADADAQDGTFYRLVFTNASGSVPTRAAQLRFFSKLDTVTPVTVTGTTYGPSGTEPKEFSVRAPNAVVKGQDIVIEGFDYLAVNGQAGSVANVLVDAEYSGDPRTLNTTRTVYHPQTGATYADKRGHNVVQAGGSDGNQGGQTIVAQDGSAQLVHYPEWDPGYFRVIIPWPDETNTTRDAAFFAEHWAAGSQHTVRFLTGSLFTPNGGDYQGGISVRFTIVDDPVVEPEDEVPPRVSASVSGRTVTVVATDEGSGVEGIETRIDSDDWQAYQAPFEVPGAAGHRVEFRAFDVAGNTSAVGSITIAATEPSGAITATALGSERTVLVGQPVQGFGVQLADETGAAVRGVPVAFAVTGGSFPAGAGTATVASNAAGIAVAPVVTGEAAGDIVITASWQGGSQVLPTVHVTAPAVSLTATAAAESVVNAGRVEIKVSATNTSAEPVTLVLKTRYGSKTFANVPVGGEVTNNFRTFLSRVPAGTATVTVSTATGTAVFEAPYEAK